MEQKDFMHTSRFITHGLKGQDLIKLICIAPPRTSEIGIFVVKLQTSGDEECAEYLAQGCPAMTHAKAPALALTTPLTPSIQI